MAAAAEFLNGQYPSASKAADAHSVPAPNVCYYASTWRNSGAVDVMIERLLAPPAARAAAAPAPTNEKEEEPEPVSTHTSITCLEGVHRSGSGLGYNSSGTDQQGYRACYKWAAAEYIAGRDKKGKQSALSEVGYRSSNHSYSRPTRRPRRAPRPTWPRGLWRVCASW